VEAVLDRLVGQFASPYDFLRELVQNAMDAGSDFVEVVLDTHHGDDGAVVYELAVVDAGKGMDEPIIDDELTRLFSSSKQGDRTMAGGFGIGFVSVFAWKPDRVLVQTGRAGEAWELVFHRDRRFEKHRLDQPLEGTTIRLFRPGRAEERPAMALAIRDSLWRWCRYSPAEITFEDVEAGEGPELVQDAPVPEDATIVHEHRHGPTHVRIAFSVPARTVLLRGGLVLADGTTREVLGELAPTLGESLDHLRVWADSPQLRPNLARDRIVDDEGRRAIGERVVAEVVTARELLLAKVEEAAGRSESWTHDDHTRLAHLHAHLAHERAQLGRRLLTRPILRRASGRAVSLQTLHEVARAGIVGVLEPGRLDASPERDLVVGALRAGIPVLVAEWSVDQEWLAPLLAEVGLIGRPLRDAISSVEPVSSMGTWLPQAVERLAGAAGLAFAAVHWGMLACTHMPALAGLSAASGSSPSEAETQTLAVIVDGLPASYARGTTLWLDPRHPLVERALAAVRADPRLVVLATTLAVLDRLEGAPEPVEVAAALDRLGALPEVVP
jgi:hypothetical protein